MLLRLLVLFWSFVVTTSCVSPLDCNAKECMDCVCKDGECSCADGWSGANCTTPFCVKRSDCSNHGDCIATLTNISCVCDAGWTGFRKKFSLKVSYQRLGARCEAASCPLNCTHGGVPDSNCTQCVGCLGAWYGKQCDQWNASAPVGTLLTMLSTIASDSQQALDSLAPIRPLCSQSQECLGSFFFFYFLGFFSLLFRLGCCVSVVVFVWMLCGCCGCCVSIVFVCGGGGGGGGSQNLLQVGVWI